MIEINVTLLIQMANFLVLLFLMNLVLYRPIRRIVAQRNKHIAEQQAVIEGADAEAAAVVQEFNIKIQEARKLGRQKIQEHKAAAYDQEKDLLQQASDQVAKQVQEMRAKVKSDIAAAREQLRKQVRTFSTNLAQKILGRSL
jgi:F-type H+-transporting ATPase subunit b